VLAYQYDQGLRGLQQDRNRAIELFTKAAELGYSNANYDLGVKYNQQGDMKKSRFHYEVAAMAGHETARNNLGCLENDSGNIVRALKHWKIAASAGCFRAMQVLITCFEEGYVSRESIDSTLKTYNNSCSEMRSEARDASIQFWRPQFL
jgi:TPR repeat protein